MFEEHPTCYPKDTSASDLKEKAGAKVPVHPRTS